MKKLSFIDKLIFIINNLMAFALVMSYLLPFISPEKFAQLAILSLFGPVLIIINIGFVIFWMIKLKKQLLLSLLVLIIGFKFINSFYQYPVKVTEVEKNGISLMSYNVKMFNLYQWIADKNTNKKIITFIKNEQADILCIQEYHGSEQKNIPYKYRFVKTNDDHSKIGQAIFSKYRIINSGSLNFKNSGNNAIFADIVIKKDTIRVYNIHLESLRINPFKEYFGEQDTERLRKRFEKAFKKQVAQTQLILDHQKTTSLKTIICGDFNNTSFSWVYRQLKKGKNDAFETFGSGFGQTFDYPFPLRIDFILVDEAIEIKQFKTLNVKYSDHFPIKATIKL